MSRPDRADLRARPRPPRQIRVGNCPQCGTRWESTDSRRRFCSDKCAAAHRFRRRYPPKDFTCRGCGKPGVSGRRRQFCSTSCRRISERYSLRCSQCGRERNVRRGGARRCVGCARTPQKATCPVCRQPFFPWKGAASHARKTCGAEACVRLSRSRRPTKEPEPDLRLILAGIPCLSCGGPVDRSRGHLGSCCSTVCWRREKKRLGLAGIRFGDILRAVIRGDMPAAGAVDLAKAWRLMRTLRQLSGRNPLLLSKGD